MSPKNWEDIPNFRKRVILLDKMPGEAFSSGRIMFCVKYFHIQQWSHCYFLAHFLPSNFIGKDGVAKSQIRFFTRLTGVLRQEKQTRHFFTQLEPVF